MPLAECDRPAEMQLRKFCKAALDVQRGTGAIYEPWIRSAAGQLLLRFSKDARAKACDGIFPDWCSHDLVNQMWGGDMSGLPLRDPLLQDSFLVDKPLLIDKPLLVDKPL